MSKAPARYYYLKDHLGSVKMTVDTSGTVVGLDDYYPYGSVMNGRSYTSSADQRYKFTGKERSATTGLDYFGARDYDSWRAQWLQVDQLARKYPAWSSYNYCLNNPIKLSDPDGMKPYVANLNDRAPNELKSLQGEKGYMYANLRDVSNVNFNAAMSLIAKGAPKMYREMQKNDFPVVFVDRFGDHNNRGGEANNLQSGMFVATWEKDNPFKLAGTMLHERVHNYSGSELDAYGAQIAAGLLNGDDYLRLLYKSAQDPDKFANLTLGIGMEDMGPGGIYNNLKDYSAGQNVDAAGKRIIRYLMKKGKKWINTDH